jgi:hypothetical protein
MATSGIYADDGSQRVTIANVDGGTIGLTVDTTGLATEASLVALSNRTKGEYETVAASQTGQTIGATGAVGDYLEGVLIVPASVNPGNVIILDNAISITIFAGGSNSVTELKPIYVPLGLTSVSGAWKVTTGANVSVIAIGNFT